MTTIVSTPELDSFQVDTLSFLDHANGRAVIADPMGARKTGTTLAWLAQRRVKRTLVVAPSSVHGHWEREAGRFYPDADVLRGNTKTKRHQALVDLNFYDEVPVIYVTTYESMKADQRSLIASSFDAVVFDEGHRLKGRTTQVGLCANAVTKKPAYLIVATGTHVINHASELWQYLHMIAPQAYPAFWRWVEEHFVIEVKNFRRNRFPTRIIHDYQPGHEAIVRAQIEPFFIQRDIAELFPGQAWVEEPEHVEIAVDLSAGERKLYDNLVKHKWGLVGGKEVTTTNGLDLSTRLNQVTSDWGNLDTGATLGTKSEAAVELILDLLERDEPVLVFAKYIATVERIAAELERKHVTAAAYHGGVDQHGRDMAVTSFGNGKCSVLIGTLDSMSEGVDGCQVRCANVVMVDRHWTAAKNDQAIGRVRRSGQLRKVQVFHVFANDTIDATITAACLRKTNVVNVLKGKPLIDAIYGRV